MKVIYVIFGILIFFKFLNWLSKKTNKLTKDEVADTIEHLINRIDKKYEWDDFVSVPIADPYLDKIRERCSRIEEEFPVPGKKGLFINNEGLEVLRSYVKELREK